jgi:hypothetical protein
LTPTSLLFSGEGGSPLFRNGLQVLRRPEAFGDRTIRFTDPPVPRSASERLVMITSVGCERYDAISRGDVLKRRTKGDSAYDRY